MTPTALAPASSTPATRPVRSVVSPLLPVVLPLVVAAIVLSVVFAWLFPPDTAAGAPALRFTDVTAEAGLRFTHQQGGAESPTTLGGAVAVLDFNNDGAPDLFFVNGAPWPWEESLDKRLTRSNALFRNDGAGHFTDVTAAAGLNTEMQGMAATAGDFDNDGLPDLFVTCVGLNHLFRNVGHGRFEDVTESAGVGGEDNTWSTGAVWLDLDHDGRLDLIVLHYARWPREVGLAQAFVIADVGRSYGAAVGFVSSFPTVYRNLGDGRFEVVANSAGLRDIDAETGRPVAQPIALTPVNADGDAHLDLLVAYHAAPNALFLNQGDGTFRKAVRAPDRRQEGAAAGLAASASLPFAQADGTDQRYQALRSAAGYFSDRALGGLAGKLGTVPVDFDLNGRVELFSDSGAIEPNINKFEEGRDFARPAKVLWSPNRRDLGSDWLTPEVRVDDRPDGLPSLVARGVAVADFDGDGDPDVVIAQNNGAPVLLRNDQRAGPPWLRLRLIATRGHPEAGGARVEVHTPRHVFTQTVAPALGFMSQSESTLTFGLGEDARVRRIVIQWPSGQMQELRPEALNQTLVVREP
ncbi:MAG TPA: CRTAC1 family protein [Lacunisphaera sp.]|nr:CRTAC1 family protein [Lacunisphaera sp.]